MRVTTTFSPVTITIERHDELLNLILALERSLEFSKRNWSIIQGRYREDFSDQLVIKLLQELRIK